MAVFFFTEFKILFHNYYALIHGFVYIEFWL